MRIVCWKAGASYKNIYSLLKFYSKISERAKPDGKMSDISFRAYYAVFFAGKIIQNDNKKVQYRPQKPCRAGAVVNNSDYFLTSMDYLFIVWIGFRLNLR